MDATKKPLRIPPTFSVYAEEHGVFQMYKRLLCQIIVDKPADPLQYTIDWLKKDNDDVPRIAVIGPPASGKSGISSAVSKNISAVHVNTDVLLDDELSEDANEAKNCLASSRPVPDQLWVNLITERLKRRDCLRRGYVLEGFPRNREQTINLQANGVMLQHIVVLDAPDRVLVERQAGKRVDPDTGDVYHTTFDWPLDHAVQERLVEPAGTSAEEVQARLVGYARDIDGILATFPLTHKKVNADQPKADVLAQTMTFVNTQQRGVAPHTPRIVLIGATGSGKNTVARRLAEKYRIVNVPCGQLIKENIAAETPLGAAASAAYTAGKKVDDNIVCRMIVNRLSQLDAAAHGWILHGYPLTRDQAESLSDAGYRPNRIYFMDIPDDCIIERLCYRLTDPVTGERFHTLYNPPRTSQAKKRCVQNPSDSEEAVRERIDEFHAYIEELADFYSDEGAVHINADQDPQTVLEFVESILVNPLPKNLGK